MTGETSSRIEIKGELSIFTATELRLQLVEAIELGMELEIDLSQVSEVDSAGLQLMVAAKREAAVRGQVLRFIGHSPAVVDALDLCNLAAHLGDPLLVHARK